MFFNDSKGKEDSDCSDEIIVMVEKKRVIILMNGKVVEKEEVVEKIIKWYNK